LIIQKLFFRITFVFSKLTNIFLLWEIRFACCQCVFFISRHIEHPENDILHHFLSFPVYARHRISTLQDTQPMIAHPHEDDALKKIAFIVDKIDYK